MPKRDIVDYGWLSFMSTLEESPATQGLGNGLNIV
jgi:hypothetical protein